MASELEGEGFKMIILILHPKHIKDLKRIGWYQKSWMFTDKRLPVKKPQKKSRIGGEKK